MLTFINKHTIYALLTLCTFIGTTLPVDEYMLETKDGKQIMLPAELKEYSELIKLFVKDSATQDESEDPISTVDIDIETFEQMLPSIGSVLENYNKEIPGFSSTGVNLEHVSQDIALAIHNAVEEVQTKKAAQQNIIPLHIITMDELEFLINTFKETFLKKPELLNDELIAYIYDHLKGNMSFDEQRMGVTDEECIGLLKAANYLLMPKVIIQAASKLAAERIKWDNDDVIGWYKLPDEVQYIISSYFMELHPDTFWPLKLALERNFVTSNEDTQYRGETVDPDATKYLDAQHEFRVFIRYTISSKAQEEWRLDTGLPGIMHDTKFSPDGRYIATIFKTPGHYEVYIADATTYEVLRKFIIESSGERHISFSPDSTLLVATEGYSAQIRHIKRKEIIQTIWAPENDKIVYAFISPDNTKLLTYSSTSMETKIWNIATGGIIRTLRVPLRRDHPPFVKAAQWSFDGNYIITTTERLATLWDSESGEEIKHFVPGKVIKAIDLSPDNTKLLLLVHDVESTPHDNKYVDEIHVYDTKTERRLFIASYYDVVNISSQASPRFSNDSKKIIYFQIYEKYNQLVARYIDFSEERFYRYLTHQGLLLVHASLMVYFDKLGEKFKEGYAHSLVKFLELIDKEHLIDHIPNNLTNVLDGFPEPLSKHIRDKHKYSLLS